MPPPDDAFIRENRIDFISAYCDRWCERCAFTSRCSSYAVHVATAMCGGDFKAGLELAVGAPPPRNEEEARQREAFLEGLNDIDITDAEMAEFERQYEARQERIKAAPLTTASMGTSVLAQQWLAANGERLAASGNGRVKAALEVLQWDVFLISVKLHRALDGRDDFLQGHDYDDDVVQNDWNGSAKVALISITRSAAAWEVIAEATGDPRAAALAAELRQLRREVERAFPDAWRFRRPGFDEQG
jgi:hypothetical protein